MVCWCFGLRGKQWSVEEERQLRQLVMDGKSLDDISRIMGKSLLSVRAKLFNSGLNKLRVGGSLGGAVATTTTATTTTPEAPVDTVKFGGIALKLKKQLSTIEENVMRLDATNELLTDPNANLSRNDVLRLRAAVVGLKTYQELYAKYVDYKRLEEEVAELRRQLASEKDKKARD
jgi:hypothetical protein